MPLRLAIRPLISATPLLAACLLAAGCGSSSGSSTAGSSTRATQALAYSECMRANGVSSFPDPGAATTGPENMIGGVAIPTTIDSESPAFQHAAHACQGHLSAVLSPQGKPQITGALKASMIAHAQCMRTHGVPAYQDPTFPATGGIETSDAGVNPESPAYEHAASVCGTR